MSYSWKIKLIYVFIETLKGFFTSIITYVYLYWVIQHWNIITSKNKCPHRNGSSKEKSNFWLTTILIVVTLLQKVKMNNKILENRMAVLGFFSLLIRKNRDLMHIIWITWTEICWVFLKILTKLTIMCFEMILNFYSNQHYI